MRTARPAAAAAIVSPHQAQELPASLGLFISLFSYTENCWDRMARATQQPERLRALWAALGDDPFLIAECLARPQLVQRLIRSWYAGDGRRHGELRQQAHAELKRYGTVQDLRKLSGAYEEVEWVNKENSGEEEAVGSVALDAAAWREQQQALGRALARPPAAEHEPGTPASARRVEGDPATAGPVGVVSGIQEREDGYYVLAVLEKEEGRLRVATVTWRKRPFAAWWAAAGRALLPERIAGDPGYRRPALGVVTACTLDTWTPTAAPPEERSGHAAVWTGTEMIVWGGYGGSYLNTGGRYDPATDTWAATSQSGAPSDRSGHTAVWTGTEMIVWGGSAAHQHRRAVLRPSQRLCLPASPPLSRALPARSPVNGSKAEASPAAPVLDLASAEEAAGFPHGDSPSFGARLLS